jgi:Ni/Co efflux regulator RcnB
MVKFVVSSLIALAVVATPVAAEAQNRGGNGWEQRQNRSQNWNPGNHRRDRGVSTGAAIGIGLGAFVLGTVLADRNNSDPRIDPRFDPRFNNRFDRRFDPRFDSDFERAIPACRRVFSSGIDGDGRYYENHTVRCR